MTIPLSPLLSEVQPEALQDLFSRDPAGYTKQDLDRVISEVRALRERIAVADANGRKSKALRADSPPPSNATPEDFGL